MNFEELNLAPAIVKAVREHGYETPTPIQAQAIPAVLEGRDLLGGAQTGTGKTAAFVLPILQILSVNDGVKNKFGGTGIRALVLTPTRELAAQVEESVRVYGKYLELSSTVVFGGVGMNPQISKLKSGVDVLVATPGRLLDLMGQGKLDLSTVEVLVLDEADRMLDGDFEAASRAIVERTPASRQTLFFSATFPDAVRVLSKRLQREPVIITVDHEVVTAQIEQTFYEVEPTRRLDALAHLLSTQRPESALVFAHTKNDAQDLEAKLKKRGYSVLSLHGDIDQRDRDEVLVRFVNGSARVLIATDVAARGLDIQDLALVISYELPLEPDQHVHRVGRTGRAGKRGTALHLFTARERSRLTAIEARLGFTATTAQLPMSALSPDRPVPPVFVTICVDAGRRDKLRPGDLLGALTGAAGLAKEAVGKISSFDTRTYVAIDRRFAKSAIEGLKAGKIKGKNFRVRPID